MVFKMGYCIYLNYLDREACANNVDPDQMPQNLASDAMEFGI